MNIFKLAVTICIVLILAACGFTLQSVTSATIERHGSGRPLQTAELNSEQIQALSAWFTQNRSGWSRSVVSYVPKLIVRAKHENGESSVINIIQTTVIVYNDSGQYQQSFSEPVIADLLGVLERSNWQPVSRDSLIK